MARGWWQNHTAVLTSIIDSVNIAVCATVLRRVYVCLCVCRQKRGSQGDSLFHRECDNRSFVLP